MVSKADPDAGIFPLKQRDEAIAAGEICRRGGRGGVGCREVAAEAAQAYTPAGVDLVLAPDPCITPGFAWLRANGLVPADDSSDDDVSSPGDGATCWISTAAAAALDVLGALAPALPPRRSTTLRPLALSGEGWQQQQHLCAILSCSSSSSDSFLLACDTRREAYKRVLRRSELVTNSGSLEWYGFATSCRQGGTLMLPGRIRATMLRSFLVTPRVTVAHSLPCTNQKRPALLPARAQLWRP